MDLCVWHPTNDDAATVEIKGWHTTTVTAHSMAQEPSLFYFLRDEARQAAAAVLGRSKSRSILVVSRIAEASRAETMDYAKQRGVELLEFEDVLRLLVTATPPDLDAGSESEHVIRVLKVYGFLKDVQGRSSYRGRRPGEKVWPVELPARRVASQSTTSTTGPGCVRRSLEVTGGASVDPVGQRRIRQGRPTRACLQRQMNRS